MTTQMVGLSSYLLLTFGIAWGLWAPLMNRGLNPNSMRFQMAILPGAFSPAIAACIVRAFITKEGFDLTEFIPKVTEWPVYSIGWLIPLLIALGTYAVICNSKWSVYPRKIRPIRSRIGLLLQLPFIALVMAPIQFGEEFGWRVYFQARLFPEEPLIAALITGVVWAIWHWPLIRMGYGYPTERRKGFAAFTLWSVLLSILLGWIFARTGDVWSVSLAHMASNTIGGSALAALLPGEQKRHLVDYGGVISSALLGITCLILVLAVGRPW